VAVASASCPTSDPRPTARRRPGPSVDTARLNRGREARVTRGIWRVRSRVTPRYFAISAIRRVSMTSEVSEDTKEVVEGLPRTVHL